jgi:hypothetical protein
MTAALNRLETEHDNLRVALEWALTANPEAALQLAASLSYYWMRRGFAAEGGQWLRESLARFDSSTTAGQALRARALVALGYIAFAYGELEAARAYLEEGGRLARAANDPHILGISLARLGLVLAFLGDEAALERVVAEGQGVVPQDDPEAQAQMLSVRAQLAVKQQDFAAARAFVEAAVGHARQSGNAWLIAISLMGLGRFEAICGQLAEARAHMEEAERVSRGMRDRRMETSMQSERAHLERRAGNLALAKALYCQTLPAFHELGHRAAVAHELECLAYLAIADRGDSAQPGAGAGLDRAARCLGAAEALRQRIRAPLAADERAEYDQHLTALRAQIEPERLRLAWAEGRGLSTEAAVALALAPA